MNPSPLTGAEIDTLYKLGRAYPHGVEDGNLPSKVGRNLLLIKYLATYNNGVTYLTHAGFAVYEARRAELKREQGGT